MEYWHDIVKSYDDYKVKDPNKAKNDGTYSQSSVVLLLIYLAFGEDYPYNIAKFFKEKKHWSTQARKYIPYSNNLITPKVGVLLNKMMEDGLVKMTEKKVDGRLRKMYAINPQILQSPSTSFYYSPFVIPLESICEFLESIALEKVGILDQKQEELLRQERHKRADMVLSRPFRDKSIDYLHFLVFIVGKASNWKSARVSSNPEKPLADMMISYMTFIHHDRGDW